MPTQEECCQRLDQVQTAILENYRSVAASQVMRSTILDTLLDIAIDLIKSCVQFTTPEKITEMASEPTFLQRFILRRNIRKSIPEATPQDVDDYYVTLVTTAQTLDKDLMQDFYFIAKSM